jgi:hypothetical protein
VNAEQRIYLGKLQFLSRSRLCKTIFLIIIYQYSKEKVDKKNYACYIRCDNNGGNVTCLKITTKTQFTDTSLR